MAAQDQATNTNVSCLAVSASADATGSWHRYSFAFSALPDFPKLAVWPDAYYMTFNGILGSLDVPACALDRARMLAGQPATQQCFSTGQRGSTIAPTDLGGSQAPPAGEPNLIWGLGGDSASLVSWKLHVDWSTPANSTLTGPTTLAVAPFASLSSAVVPQPGTTQVVTPGAGTPTHRVVYRNYGDHEALVMTHVVNGGGDVAAMRWYELRLSAGSPTLFQQGTYAPGDGVHRFMGDISADRAGDFALGYSVSNATSVFPGIRFTGRTASDPAGQMPQTEATIVGGGSSWTLNARWGDYTSMAVDPLDDCTFWYANQYLATTPSGSWRTRLATFRFPGCVNPNGAIVNSGFETGDLTGWTASGKSGVTTSGPHSGTFAAVLGSTTSPTNGDSSIKQTFTAPAGATTLSFWYNVACPDTVTFDWATATLQDNTNGTTTTPLRKTCTNTGTWQHVTAALAAGHSYTLTLTSHDDNAAGDPTATKYDDVTV
jgi:hypothetical protein